MRLWRSSSRGSCWINGPVDGLIELDGPEGIEFPYVTRIPKEHAVTATAVSKKRQFTGLPRRSKLRCWLVQLGSGAPCGSAESQISNCATGKERRNVHELSQRHLADAVDLLGAGQPACRWRHPERDHRAAVSPQRHQHASVLASLRTLRLPRDRFDEVYAEVRVMERAALESINSRNSKASG